MYFLKRLLMLGPLLLIISFVAFVLVHLAPGGPFDRERRPASPEIERALQAKYHLDEPVLKQYLRYLGLMWEKDASGHWGRLAGRLFHRRAARPLGRLRRQFLRHACRLRSGSRSRPGTGDVVCHQV